MHLIAAQHRVRDAIVVENGVLVFEADLDDARPMPALEKARHGAVDKAARVSGGFFHEIGQGPADDLLEGQADQIGEAAVDGSDVSFQSEREQNVIERIDQVAVALLGALDYGEQLIELPVAGRFGIALLQATNQTAQLGNFPGPLPRVPTEKNYENDQADRQRLEPKRKGANVIPGDHRENDGHHEKQEKSEPPELALAFLEVRETIGNRGTLGTTWRRTRRGALHLFPVLWHDFPRDLGSRFWLTDRQYHPL